MLCNNGFEKSQLRFAHVVKTQIEEKVYQYYKRVNQRRKEDILVKSLNDMT